LNNFKKKISQINLPLRNGFAKFWRVGGKYITFLGVSVLVIFSLTLIFAGILSAIFGDNYELLLSGGDYG